MRWFLLITTFLCVACTPKQSAPTPRPYAYPRIDLYPEEYRQVEILGMPLQINSSAKIIAKTQPGWFDIIYDDYGVTVQATLTLARGDELQRVLDNRTERMARNLGGASAELTQGQDVTLLVAPTALRTPVQILLTDSLTYALSAVAVTDWPATTPPDSVAPILPALAADLLHLHHEDSRAGVR